MKRLLYFTLTCFIVAFAFNHDAVAQKRKKKSGSSTAAALGKGKKPSIKKLTKSCKAYEGLFTVYQDTIKGNAYLLLKTDQIGKDFIYFSYTENGVLAAGHFRGSYRGSKVFTIKRYFNRIEFVTKNTGYYFDPDNAISKAAEANINQSILVSEAIAAEDTAKKEILIKADGIFLTEKMYQVKSTPNPRNPFAFKLGRLSKDKTKYASINSYPENTDVVIEYVYDNPTPMVFGGKEVTDPRAVTIKFQHSFIELPDNNFVPRRDDPRLGYFGQQVEDMTATGATPYKDLINRWHLEKKDKDAAISEPVKPITWWIENTTPKEFRATIMEAGLMWNKAFEKAGFKNAIEMKIQPDTADWDAGDIRYNVLRWTSSPRPPFGGYGPSFANPLTGQILGADIMLEYVFITNRLKQDKLYTKAGLENTEQLIDDPNYCSLGHHLHNTTMFGTTALKAAGLSPIEIDEYIKASLYYLVLHEMGHTLGLNHNMKASQLHSPDVINDKNLTGQMGLTGSVMDYPAVNLSLDKEKQGHYFTMRPGPYDEWAIEYGYSEALDNAQEEEARLARILARSTDPKLAFGNDADDMRFPGFGIDPRVMIGDMSSDVIGYSESRIKLCNQLTEKLKERYSDPGKSYQELYNAFAILTNEYATAARVTSRYIGGVYVDRGFAGQDGSSRPYTPVSLTDQKRAMKVLSDYLFAPNAFTNVDEELYSHLQKQRRGFNFFFNNEDPRLHQRVLFMQMEILAHLTSSNLLQRITDTRLYGNQYDLVSFMTDLTNAIFKADATTNVNTFRQNLQVAYINKLATIVNDKNGSYDNLAKAAAFASMNKVKGMMKRPVQVNAETKAHRSFVLYKINQALETK